MSLKAKKKKTRKGLCNVAGLLYTTKNDIRVRFAEPGKSVRRQLLSIIKIGVIRLFENVIFRCHFNTIYPSQYLNYLVISIKSRQQHPVCLFTQGNGFQFSLFSFLVQGRASLRKSIKNQYIRY